MAKMFRCGDLMSGCDTVIHGHDEAEVLGKAEDHARKAHNMTLIPPDMVQGITDRIKDDPDGDRRHWFSRR